MGAFTHELRFGTRSLLHRPGFTAMVVATLALGIGVNTGIFSVVNAALLKPRPGIREPGRLVDIGRSQDGRGFDNFSHLNYLDYRDRNTTLSAMLENELELRPVSLRTPEGGRRLYASIVSGNYFDVLGARPGQGRFFLPEEDRTPGTHLVTVLSDACWKRHFSGDPGIVGREIAINGQGFRVVGVAEPGFVGSGPLAPDAWFPIMTVAQVMPGRGSLSHRGDSWVTGIGRLKPGVTLEQARADLTAIAAQLEREYPEENRGRGLTVLPYRTFPGEIHTLVAWMLGILSVIVGLVLLIACTNVAGMLLVQAASRRREIALRLSLGATRRRVAGRLLLEGTLLFVAGGGAGLLVAAWMRDALRALIPKLPVPVHLDLSLDRRVLLFTLGLSLVTGLLFSLAPALHGSRTGLFTSLKGGTGDGPRRLPLRKAIVLVQVAASLVLLVGAGLFWRALGRAASIDPGIRVANLHVLSLDFSLAGYQEAEGVELADRLLERVRAVAGVESASLAWRVPLDGSIGGLGGFTVPGRLAPDGTEVFDPAWDVVTPGHFRTLGASLVAGRDFTIEDRPGAPAVAIVNQTTAQRLWPGESAIGRTVFQTGAPGEPRRPLQVVGVARDQKYKSLDDASRLFIYVPLAQNYLGQMNLMIGTAVPRRVLPVVRDLLRDLDPDLPIVQQQSMAEVVALSTFPQRLAGQVAGCLGLLGLLLSGMGIFGVTSHAVQQRTSEFGLRIALGAQPREVLRLVMRQTFLLAAIGLVSGIGLAGALSQLLGGMLYGLNPLDPPTYLGVAGLVGAVALAATWFPARRATKVDPMIALRCE